MRTVLDPDVERQRVDGPAGAGPYGAFRLLCPETGRTLLVIASDGRGWADVGLAPPAWEHVSVSARLNVPTWAEMCWVKGLFWGAEEWVVQYHPAQAEYVNEHARCLHLWAPVGVALPVPPKECV